MRGSSSRDGVRKCCWVCTTELHWADLVRTHSLTQSLDPGSILISPHIIHQPPDPLLPCHLSCLLLTLDSYYSLLSVTGAHGCGCVWWQWWCSEWSLEPTERGWTAYTCTAYTGPYCAVPHCTPLHTGNTVQRGCTKLYTNHITTPLTVVILENEVLTKDWQFIDNDF